MSDLNLEGKTFLSFLNNLERKVAPETMRTPEFNYWPIIRFALNYRRKMGTGYMKGSVAFSGATLVKNMLRGRFEIDFVGQAQDQLIKRSLNLERCDVMFLTREKQYAQMTDGTRVHPLIDGLREINEGPGAKSLTYVTGGPWTQGDRLFLDPLEVPAPGRFRPRQYLKPRDIFEYRLRLSILRKLEEVNLHIPASAAQLVVDPREILHRIEVTTLQFYHWMYLLKAIAPKVIFLSSFSGAHYVCAAARRLGIIVVDVQHGGMNPYHPIVCNWDNAPKEGYELLPDVFWCWNGRSASYIRFDAPAPHRAFIGGNPKTALEFQEYKDTVPAPLVKEQRNQIGKLRIMVALQYGGETLVRPHVKRAFEAQKDRFDWVFRLHPMGWDRVDEAVTELGLNREQLEADSRVPLHLQLPQMDLVLTNASTIVFEAREYGADAAVCSAIGAAVFDVLIEEGEILVAENDEQIAAVLDGLASRRSTAVPPADIAKQNLGLVQSRYAELLSEVGLDPDQPDNITLS